MADIIDFVTKKVSRIIEERTETDITDLMGHFTSQILNEVDKLGYDINDEEFILNFMYSMEMLRATLCVSRDVGHNLNGKLLRDARQYFEDNETI